MMTLITILYMIIAVALVALVLLQDSKSDGALGMGGSNSNSALGATGAQSLASKMTLWTAVLFALGSLLLTYLLSHSQKSVIDSLPTAPIVAPQDGTAAVAPSVNGTGIDNKPAEQGVPTENIQNTDSGTASSEKAAAGSSSSPSTSTTESKK